MKNSDYFEALKEVNLKKMELLRPLTEEEIAAIVTKYGKLSFLQKKGIIKEANGGLKSIDSLYTLYRDQDLELDQDRYDFLVLSIDNVSKELKLLNNYINKPNISIEQLNSIYTYGLMRLIVIKQKYGLSTEEYNSFIKQNRDLYDRLVLECSKSNSKIK